MTVAVREQQRFTNRRWDFSSANYSLPQLQQAVPRAALAWARSHAREQDRPVIKGDLKLPFKLTDGTINLNAVRNALAILGGARGGVDLPSATKAQSQRELERVLERGNRALRREGVERVEEGLLVTEIAGFFAKPKVDREKGIVSGVKFLGPVSKNRRRYHKALAQDGVAALYEGKKVNLDHPSVPGQPRSVRDRFAILRNCRVSNEGGFGDLHFNPEHSWAGEFCWWAENAPEGIGLSPSHVVDGEEDGEGWLDVESIVFVQHVDVVADAGTTDSLYEGVGAVDEAADDLGREIRRRRTELEMSVEELARRVGVSAGMINEMERGEMRPSAAQLRRIAAALRVSFDRLNSLEGTMDYDKITLEGLKEHRPDLIEEAIDTKPKGDKTPADGHDEAIRKLTNELDEHKAREAVAVKKGQAEKLITEAELPDEAVSDVFRAQLVAAKDEEAMKALVEDRKKLAFDTPPQSREKGFGHETGSAKVETADDFAAAVTE